MESSDQLFKKQRTVHQILGGGFVADVFLWREGNLTLGILLIAFSIWVVFERSGYTLLSFSSSVMLLLITILFVWSKAAELLNRPGPSIPDIYLTEEVVAEIGELVRTNINTFIVISRNVALGKDSRLFLRVAACLLLFSVVGGLTDIVSLCYICILTLLTLPALYERYQDHIDRCLMYVCTRIRQFYVKLEEFLVMLRKLDIEKIQ